MIVYDGNIADVTLIIKHAMLDNNVTQKDICNYTGWSKATVSNLLNNRTSNPSLRVVMLLCNAVGLDLVIGVQDRDNKDGDR